jgi:Transposase DDE domain
VGDRRVVGGDRLLRRVPELYLIAAVTAFFRGLFLPYLILRIIDRQGVDREILQPASSLVNTIWPFREVLTRARLAGRPAIEVMFERFNTALAAAGFVAMSGQIIDASIVAAPKQRNTDGEKRGIKEGRIPADWANHPAKLRQKDRDARGTVKYTKAKPSEDGALRVDLAIPAFGYKNHIGIDRRHRLIRRWTVTDAARHDGALLPELIDRHNTAGDVWADTAYRSKANERFLAGRLLRSQIHRKKPGQADAAPHRPRQCPQIGGARGGRARLCPAERADAPVRAHHRPGPRANQDRPGQPGLQHAPDALADCPGRSNLTDKSRPRRGRVATSIAAIPPITDTAKFPPLSVQKPRYWRCGHRAPPADRLRVSDKGADPMTLYVALDVSLEKTAVCVMNAEGTSVIERTVPSEAAALADLLAALPERPERIGLEAGRSPNGWCAASPMLGSKRC